MIRPKVRELRGQPERRLWCKEGARPKPGAKIMEPGICLFPPPAHTIISFALPGTWRAISELWIYPRSNFLRVAAQEARAAAGQALVLPLLSLLKLTNTILKLRFIVSRIKFINRSRCAEFTVECKKNKIE